MAVQNVETSQEPCPGAPNPKDCAPKKAYHSPSLVDWGSLFELTGGPTFDVQDDEFTGSGGD